MGVADGVGVAGGGSGWGGCSRSGGSRSWDTGQTGVESIKRTRDISSNSKNTL